VAYKYKHGNEKIRNKTFHVKERYGKLVITGSTKKMRALDLYFVTCDCGHKGYAKLQNMLNGRTTSCGCAKYDKVRKHGMFGTPTYYSWASLVHLTGSVGENNCYNTFYRKHNIKMDKNWRKDFRRFYKDMGERPSFDYQLRRKDTTKNFTKKNCTWVNIKRSKASILVKKESKK